MPVGLRRFAWWTFLVAEVGLVSAASAYVGLGTPEFWLVFGAAALAVIAYVVTVRKTPTPKLGEAPGVQERWYWF